MKRIYLVRHGRTAWNAEGRFQGQSDVPLSEHGLEEARAVARALSHVPIRAAFSSDLQRASRTAHEILALHPRVELALDERLRERNYGDWEGLTWAQIVERAPQGTTLWTDPAAVQPPGGETYDQLRDRVRPLIDEWKQHPADHLLIVTHAGFKHACMSVLFGEHSRANGLRFEPTSITELDFSNELPRLVRLNDSAHLATVQ